MSSSVSSSSSVSDVPVSMSVVGAGVCSRCLKKVKDYPHTCDDGTRRCAKCLKRHKKGSKCKKCPLWPNYDRVRIYNYLVFNQAEDAIPLEDDPDVNKEVKGFLLLFTQGKLDAMGLLHELDQRDRWDQTTLIVFKHKLLSGDYFLVDDEQ